MKNKSHLLQTIVAILVVFSLLFTNIQSALAGQEQSADPKVAGKEETVRRDYHPETGKLAFLGAQPGGEMAVEDATNPSFGPSERAESMLAAYASEFGIRSVPDELKQKDIRQSGDREITRYQQVYQGIPVMGGELVVNATTKGGLLSMNGEISPDLALDTTPVIPAEEARASALSMVAKGNQMALADFETSEPELWIYDSRLLEPDGMLPALVWRMDVRAVEGGMPVNELVLIDARRGHVALHFNQVDTFWRGQAEPPNPTAEPTAEPIPPAMPEPLPLPGEPASQQGEADALTATWYVATTGDDSNDCLTPDTPCATINGATDKSAAGDTVKITNETYIRTSGEYVVFVAGENLSGGWNQTFTSQEGFTIIDGQNTYPGVYVYNGASIDRFQIQNGFSSYDVGGIHFYWGKLTLNNSLVIHNRTNGYNSSSAAGIDAKGDLVLNNTTVAYNIAPDGGNSVGGIRSDESHDYAPNLLTLNNSTVTQNQGGGISIVSSSQNYGQVTNINNSTITRNSGPFGGLEIRSSYQSRLVTVRNSIIAGNSGSLTPDCKGTINVSDHNLIGDTAGCVVVNGVGDQLNKNPLISIYPVGPLRNHPLSADSPAIDAGNPATCLPDDQRGLARVGNCDIGAYEYTIPGSAASLSVLNGNYQRTAPNLAFRLPLGIAVLDSQGSPVPGVEVTFTAPASGPSGIFANTGTNTSSVFTDAGGFATTSPFIANNEFGTFNVSASAADVSSVNFNLQNSALYVSSSGNDSNTCLSADFPCLTINDAISKAVSGDTILITSGTYIGSGTEVVLINKDVALLGGWDPGFTTQSGMSIIDGQKARRGARVAASIFASLDHFNLQNGHASNNGGGILNSGNLTITNSVIQNNRASSSGGGISNAGGALFLSNSTINNNKASSIGGAIYSQDSSITLNNVTMSNNSAYSGGGIYNEQYYSGEYGKLLIINNSTISNNSASQGGGIHTGSGKFNVSNSILADNIGSSGPDCYAYSYYGGNMISSKGYNLIGNNQDCAFASTTGDLVGTSSRPIKPRLTPLQDNGGFTLTYAPLVGSPAINAGNPATPGSGENACLATDQRGVARPVGARCDIGAYEGAVPWVPSPLVSTYTANGTSTLPGTLLCNQSQPNCTNGSNPHADGAHKYALGTYNFYAEKHLRDSIDNGGMIIKSTVQYCSPSSLCPDANAFWNGAQMAYGSAYGFPLADDVVAHELTHGVTQYESNLFYYYQSGAINESLSDIWGELYDQSNGLGNDTAGVKWLMGEDVSGLGAIRSMSNPPAYGDPDSLSSPNYYVGEEDNGGVHYNSGVNNKAAYLMVQGGSFGGKTVTALGVNKTLAIYYEAQTNLLVSGSDYADLYNLLYQACLNQVGNDGILMADCQEVRDATDAVKMDQQPANDPGYNPDTPLCSTYSPNMVFSDDLEAGSTNWIFDWRWSYDSPYDPLAHSGEHYLYADDYFASVSDTSATLKELSVPYNAYLHFSHTYNFESFYYNSKMYYFDGGVLEYSTNAGLTWNDAGWMMDSNGYKGVIYKDWVNPLKNRPAFVGNTKGYVSTRLNLAPLAGSNVKFRWRMGLDDTGAAWGWWLDDVKMYTCGPDTSFADVPNTHWAWQYIETLYSARITGGCRTSPLSYCPNNTVTRGQMAVFLLKGIHGSSYAPPLVGDSTGFNDVPVTHWAAAWVKQLAAEGITGGCGNGNYCPENPVTRAQMAVFLLKAKHGNSYTPPALGDAGSGFADVPADNLFAPWIKQLAAEGITGGCSSGNYCPNNAVTRAQMAVFLVKAFELP